VADRNWPVNGSSWTLMPKTGTKVGDGKRKPSRQNGPCGGLLSGDGQPAIGRVEAANRHPVARPSRAALAFDYRRKPRFPIRIAWVY
jgi:hypothetical protein